MRLFWTRLAAGFTVQGDGPPRSEGWRGGEAMSRHFRLLLAAASLWVLTGPPVYAQPPAAKGTPRQGKGPVHVDLFGDPLPPGALARLGTLRFRPDGLIHD